MSVALLFGPAESVGRIVAPAQNGETQWLRSFGNSHQMRELIQVQLEVKDLDKTDTAVRKELRKRGCRSTGTHRGQQYNQRRQAVTVVTFNCKIEHEKAQAAAQAIVTKGRIKAYGVQPYLQQSVGDDIEKRLKLVRADEKKFGKSIEKSAMLADMLRQVRENLESAQKQYLAASKESQISVTLWPLDD